MKALTALRLLEPIMNMLANPKTNTEEPQMNLFTYLETENHSVSIIHLEVKSEIYRVCTRHNYGSHNS